MRRLRWTQIKSCDIVSTIIEGEVDIELLTPVKTCKAGTFCKKSFNRVIVFLNSRAH